MLGRGQTFKRWEEAQDICLCENALWSWTNLKKFTISSKKKEIKYGLVCTE